MRDQIFVGRNAQIGDFEQRFDDVTKPQPTVVFASGLQKIGRKTLIKYALRKTNLVRETYEPIRIDLSRDDSVEGFILKLYDLAITEELNVSDLLIRSIDEKADICVKLINDIAAHNEILLLDDDYCIIRFEGDIAPWFEQIVSKLPEGKLALCVACSARPARHKYVRHNSYFFAHIPELEKSERAGLFKRYAELLKLELCAQDFANFIPLLKGFPEQVTYATTLISELGSEKAFKNSSDIINFSIRAFVDHSGSYPHELK